jgi:hypothetical protein
VLARLGEVSQRVLVMTSDTDNLAAAYNRALERARNSRGHKFAGNHPILTPARAASTRRSWCRSRAVSPGSEYGSGSGPVDDDAGPRLPVLRLPRPSLRSCRPRAVPRHLARRAPRAPP